VRKAPRYSRPVTNIAGGKTYTAGMTSVRGNGGGAARYERERGFHDAKYSDVGVGQTEKYYAVLDSCYDRYKQVVEQDCAGRDILEYGCGKGSHAYDLVERGARVTGIDISPIAIKGAERAASRRALDIRFVEMNAECLDFPPESFDLICGASILHHLDLDIASAQLARCLRPGGTATFVEPLGHNPFINLYRRRTPRLRTPDEHPLRMSDFGIFRRYFADVEVEYFALTSLAAYPFRQRRAFPAILARLDALDRLAFSRLPALRRFGWFCVTVLREPRPGPPDPGGRRLVPSTGRRDRGRPCNSGDEEGAVRPDEPSASTDHESADAAPSAAGESPGFPDRRLIDLSRDPTPGVPDHAAPDDAD
jgi:SAM-dependent methyltransferase